jgi:uncharacterized protein
VSGSISELLAQFVVLFFELMVLLVAVSSALALAARRTGLARLQRWLGGSRLSGAAKGMGVGFLVPFCTYSAIPAFVGMVDARVRTATLAGFLLAAPLLDPVVLAVLLLLFGWQATLAYTLVTGPTVFLLALLADTLHAERLLIHARQATPIPVTGPATPDPSAACGPDPFSDHDPWRGLRTELRSAVAYAVTLVRGLALPVLLAVALAAAIIGLVPEQLLARLAGPDNPLAVPTAAVLGAPFYVSTEAFLPIASALHAGGMSIGAVFALVISAAGVNLPELTLLSRLMKPRLLAAYTTAVVSSAIVAGYLIPLLL